MTATPAQTRQSRLSAYDQARLRLLLDAPDLAGWRRAVNSDSAVIRVLAATPWRHPEIIANIAKQDDGRWRTHRFCRQADNGARCPSRSHSSLAAALRRAVAHARNFHGLRPPPASQPNQSREQV